MRQIVTLTTDFGVGSRYVAAMKGVLLGRAPGAVVVDITHAVPPQDIEAGAIALAETAPWFPTGTLHIAVVDPGVGTQRRLLYAEIGDQRFLAPDNGLLGLLAGRTPPSKLIAITEPRYWLPEVSRTFHGRDILAPVAAHLCCGLDAGQLGPEVDGLTPRAAGRAETCHFEEGGRVVGRRIDGRVIEVDSFGNLITNINSKTLEGVPRDPTVTIECDGHQTIGIFDTYADQPPMTLIALIGSGGLLELSIVNDSASAMLGVKPGAAVVVRW